ncbi:SIR2 family protein [Vibrio atlanticus]|uniref:SIR2 family protein n=1 Tax=Vibrio atlanticus TaxID=693153 RepID=UPI003553829C
MKFDDLRKELSHKERSIKDLTSYLGTRVSDTCPNYSLLLGAGASVTSGIRSGQALVKEWRQDLYEMYSRETFVSDKIAKDYLISNEGSWYTEANEYSALFEKKFDLPSQRRRFVEMEVDKAMPSIGYAYLASLADSANRFFDTIFTTNFDDLINEAFYQFSHHRPLVCAHDSSVQSLSVSSTRPKIIKLHGDYLFDDIKSTLRETESLESNIKNKFIEFSKEYGLIVMGYAGHDRSIMDVITHLLKSEEYFKNGIYWCVRTGDPISPELRKLLWKDRVYWVEVDGFDNIMAELHHNLKGGLPIKDNLSESKQERIVESFTRDKSNLAISSAFISKDLANLKKHKNELDISNSIRELNNTDENDIGHISESEFNFLLKIDTLVKAEKYEHAKSLAESHLSNADNIYLKIRYLRKLVYISNMMKHREDAHNYCDKLIELDEQNHEYYILKGSIYETTSETCQYLKPFLERFKNVVRFNNHIIRRGMKDINNSDAPTFNIDEILEIVERSLKLDPSLDNGAWILKCDVLSLKHSNVNDQKANKALKVDVEELIHKAKNINPNHMTCFKVRLSTLGKRFIPNTIETTINDIIDSYESSRLSRKSVFLDYICMLYIEILGQSKKDVDHRKNLSEFLTLKSVSSFEDKERICSFRLIQAINSFNIDKDFSSFKEHLLAASKCKDAYNLSNKIINIGIKQLKDIDFCREFLESSKSKISKSDYYSNLCDILIFENKLDEALDCCEVGYRSGNDKQTYITNKVYILLLMKQYTQLQAFVENNIDKLIDKEEKNIITVNAQAALKFSGKAIDKVKLRNIIANESSEHVKLCAHILLDQESQAKRVIKANIEYDPTKLQLFKSWPIISANYLSEYEDITEKEVTLTSVA